MRMNSFKVKLRKIGNSIGVIIPKNVITNYSIGDDIELEVKLNVITSDKSPVNVITSKKSEFRTYFK